MLYHIPNIYLSNNSLFAFLIIIILIYFFCIHVKYWISPHYMSSSTFPTFKTFVINLDKDRIKQQNFVNAYHNSDMNHIQLKRFPAINGKNVITDKWLTPSSTTELKTVLSKGFRTHHYQLTPGAVGCFISHYTLAKQLLNDTSTESYLIFEDDISINPHAYRKLKKLLHYAPPDWDMITFHTHRVLAKHINKHFTKVDGFWGMTMYLIHKRGAKKFVDYVDNHRIDGQVDAYLSKMGQQGLINIYSSKVNLCTNIAHDTNIQMKIIPSHGQNPFLYQAYLV
mgnify:FL=1